MDDWRNRYEWDYYSQSRPRQVEGGMKTKSERGAIGETWWSKRWVHVLEEFGMGTRLARGRSYARKGQVVSIDVEPGTVKARVQGSLREPYKISIRLDPLTKKDWDKVTEAMAAQAIFAAKLLAGEMPSNIEEAFSAVDLSLFPLSEDDLVTKCSCPDWANPCKHIAAVYYILAEHFDEDPFLIFKLRGRSKEEIIAALRQKRSEVVAPATRAATATSVESGVQAEAEQVIKLEDLLTTFWQAGAELNAFSVNAQQSGVDKAVLKRLGEAPFSIGKQNVATVLSHAYDVVYETATQKMEEIQADVEL